MFVGCCLVASETDYDKKYPLGPLAWMGNAPVRTVAHKPFERFVYPARLTAGEKQVLWARIKRDKPELVDWFADPVVREMQAVLGAEVFLKEGDV